MLILLAACFDEENERLEALELAEGRWADAGFEDYTYTLTWSCFCPEGGVPVQVEVVDGAVASFTAEEDIGETFVPSTIPDLFDAVRDAIEDDPHAFEAVYDTDLGYPTSVTVDPIENAIDEEWGFTVTDLQAGSER
ncbi:MAG: DUF6174 domain-containing protein [Myxococcota bacterium]